MSREIDAMVAEMMGYEKAETPYGCDQYWKMPSRDPDPAHRKEYPYWYKPFKPSEDVASAWEVVDKMAKGGWHISVELTGAYWDAKFWGHGLLPESTQRWNPSAAKAICLAALAAVGVEAP